MRKPSFSRNGRIRGAVYSLFILVLFLTAQWLPGKSLAQGVFSAAEQIYLKNITPLLYEFSQAAAGVSGSLLKLQSAPPEECASQFADYRGIIGSISRQLGSLTPPPRLETVHQYAAQSLDGYSAGLELYFKACTEEDFGVKESLVSQGGIFINKSVVTLGKAYEEIENVKAAGPAVVKNEAAEQITESEISEAAADYSPDESGLEDEPAGAASPTAPAPEVKTKAQVLAEISEKVQADMEARGEAGDESPAPDIAVGEAPPAVQPQEEVSEPVQPAEEPPVKMLVKEEVPEAPAAEPASPPSERAQVKTGESPASEPIMPSSENARENAEDPLPADPSQSVKTEAASEEAEEDIKPDKEDIERLNQKIMEQSQSMPLTKVAENIGSTGPETPQSKVPGEEEGAAEDSGGSTADASNSDNAAPRDDRVVAALPPGEASQVLEQEGASADDVKSWCQERCQTPAELDSCMKSRAAAKDKINKLTNAFPSGTKEKGILDKCMSDWKESSTFNYEMVISCTQFYCTLSGIEKCKDLSK